MTGKTGKVIPSGGALGTFSPGDLKFSGYTRSNRRRWDQDRLVSIASIANADYRNFAHQGPILTIRSSEWRPFI